MIYKNTIQNFINFLSIKKYEYKGIESEKLLNSFTNNINHTFSIRSMPCKQRATHFTLTELADFFGTDKGSSYFHKHLYTLIYETIFTPYYNEEINLLEIGVSENAPSLKLWREYFGIKANIYGFDINSSFENYNNISDNIKVYIGDQSNPKDLEKCNENNYDIIIDDGSHYSAHQQISLKELWKYVKSGGVYVIENLHWQPSNDTGTKTRELLYEWKNNNIINSDFISKEEAEIINKDIKSIDFYNSQSPFFNSVILKGAFCAIFKK